MRPEVTLPDDLTGLEISVDDVTVSDEDVEEQLSSLRDRFATLQPVERPIQDGDYLTLDLTASIDGEVVPGSESKGLTYEVGTENLIPGLDEAIRGASESDERTFPTELKQGDFAGQTAEVSAKVISVKEKELPELDDDFATTASEFDTLEELRTDLRERLEKVRRFEQGAQARDRVLDRLMELVDVPLPESAVKAEVEGREHNLHHQLERFGITKEITSRPRARPPRSTTPRPGPTPRRPSSPSSSSTRWRRRKSSGSSRRSSPSTWCAGRSSPGWRRRSSRTRSCRVASSASCSPRSVAGRPSRRSWRPRRSPTRPVIRST